MKKVFKWCTLLGAITLYIVGNNQIAYASDKGDSMVSNSSIYFDQAYTPPDPHAVIPDGNTTLPLDTTEITSQDLPRAGEEGVFKSQTLGLAFLLGSLGLLFKLNKQKEKTKI